MQNVSPRGEIMPGMFSKKTKEARTAGNGKQDWGTPQKLFDFINSKFRFTVDGCAHSDNNKLPRYWAPWDDCFSQPWHQERIWFNPPFDSKNYWHKRIVEKMQDERAGNPRVWMIIPFDPSTALWRKILFEPLVECIYSVEGKVAFVLSREADGTENYMKSMFQPMAIVAYRYLVISERHKRLIPLGNPLPRRNIKSRTLNLDFTAGE